MDWSKVEKLRARGAPVMFEQNHGVIYDELAQHYASEDCANRELFPDQIESYQFRTFAYGLGAYAASSQNAYEQSFAVFAKGEALDQIVALRNIFRSPGQQASTQIRFTPPTPLDADIVIREGVRVANTSADVIFQTKESVILEQGASYIDVDAQAIEIGAAANHLEVDTINEILDPIGFLEASNITKTGGGADSESDDDLLKRYLEHFENLSGGGSKASYLKYIREALPSITALEIVSWASEGVTPAAPPGEIHIYALGADGVALTTEERSTVLNYLRAPGQNRVPHGDKIVFLDPVKVDISLTLSVRVVYPRTALQAQIHAACETVADDLRKQLGRDLAPSDFIAAAKNIDGVIDASTGDLVYIDINPIQYANVNSITVNLTKVDG